MNEFLQALIDFAKTLRPWVIVAPWEQGVRVRCGRYTRVLNAGFYFKIPILDKVYVLPTRRQFVNLPPLDIEVGKSPLTLAMIVGFNIEDVEKVLNSVTQPEDAVADMVASFAARYVREHMSEGQGSIGEMEERAAKDLANRIPGLSNISVTTTMLCRDKRLRLIMAQQWGTWAGPMKTGES